MDTEFFIWAQPGAQHHPVISWVMTQKTYLFMGIHWQRTQGLESRQHSQLLSLPCLSWEHSSLFAAHTFSSWGACKTASKSRDQFQCLRPETRHILHISGSSLPDLVVAEACLGEGHTQHPGKPPFWVVPNLWLRQTLPVRAQCSSRQDHLQETLCCLPPPAAKLCTQCIF